MLDTPERKCLDQQPFDKNQKGNLPFLMVCGIFYALECQEKNTAFVGFFLTSPVRFLLIFSFCLALFRNVEYTGGKEW
jgi:hypothetical protein